MNGLTDLPIPLGWSRAEVWSTMSSFSIDGSPEGALQPYVNDSFGRFLRTWNLAKDLFGSCLELGANPYFTSWLLSEFSALDLTFANFFGSASNEGTQLLEWVSRDGRGTKQMDFDHFNLEEQEFPYKSDSFDCVLHCEIIEHLLMDPLHSLREISRILKPGGRLILTTPNVARIGNVRAIIEGRSIYDPYSGFGPYGRHNREYSLDELVRLVRFSGFELELAFTADSHEEPPVNPDKERLITKLIAQRENDLGQYLFIRAVRVRDPKVGFPSWLFRSLSDELVVED